MELKDIVRQARRGLKITQTELAKLAGVDSSTINNLESGKQKGLGGALLVKLSKALGVEPAILVPDGSARLPADFFKGHKPPVESARQGHCCDVADHLAELPPERAEWFRAKIMVEAAAARLARIEARHSK